MAQASVIIPAYNAERTLRQTVASALSQTYTDLEVLVIDDASTQRSGDHLSDISDTRLRVHRQPRNRGAAAARNVGVRLAHSPLVCQLDADDWWEATYLEEMIPLFAEPAIGLAYSDAYMHGHSTGRASSTEDPAKHPIDRFPALGQRNPITACTVTMRRSAVLSVGGYPSWLANGEDYYLYLKLAAAGWRFAYRDQRLSNYRWPTQDRGKSGEGSGRDANYLKLALQFGLTHRGQDLPVWGFYAKPFLRWLRHRRGFKEPWRRAAEIRRVLERESE